MTEKRKVLLRGMVHPWHHDHYGHMNVRWYGHFFDDATYHLWSAFGIGLKSMQKDFGVHTVTARATTNFIQELEAGDLIVIDGAVARLGTKSAAFELRMLHAETGAVHATCDVVEVFFDPETRQSAAIPDAMRAALSAFLIQSSDSPGS